MAEIFRTLAIFSIDPASAIRMRRWITIGARLLFWPLLLLTLVALALGLGAYRKEFKIAGPFAAETNPARHSLILEVPQEGRAAWWRQPLLGDDSGKPSQSFLELWIDGREMGPPHTLHETIREGTTTGFSHWGPKVIFSLPPGVKNAPETIATLRYTVRPRAWVTFTLVCLECAAWLASPSRERARRDQSLGFAGKLWRATVSRRAESALSDVVWNLRRWPDGFGGVHRLQPLRLCDRLGTADHGAHSLVASGPMGRRAMNPISAIRC